MFISVLNICERKQRLGTAKNEAKLLTVPLCFEWPVSALSRGCKPNQCCRVACAWPTHGRADLKRRIQEKMLAWPYRVKTNKCMSASLRPWSVALRWRQGTLLVWLSLNQARPGQPRADGSWKLPNSLWATLARSHLFSMDLMGHEVVLPTHKNSLVLMLYCLQNGMINHQFLT